MKKDLLKIIEHYGVMKQLKYFQSEVFELNEAIIKAEQFHPKSMIQLNASVEDYINHIAEEIADVLVMLNQFKEYYSISDENIAETFQYKLDRQLERIKNESNNNI